MTNGASLEGQPATHGDADILSVLQGMDLGREDAPTIPPGPE